MKHEAGCPILTDFSLTEFMHKYPWIFGLIMIILGPFVSMYGRRFFPKVLAGIVIVSAMVVILVASSYLGLMASGMGIILSIIIALGLSIFLA
jgi:hypothetical protein